MKPQFNSYSDEARKRWGKTDAYKESERRTAGFSQNDWEELSGGMDEIMSGFARLNAEGISPGSEGARLQVGKLKSFISERLYTCTDEILAGLGEMYAADERFAQNIDRHGEGTALYVRDCIRAFVE